MMLVPLFFCYWHWLCWHWCHCFSVVGAGITFLDDKHHCFSVVGTIALLGTIERGTFI